MRQIAISMVCAIAVMWLQGCSGVQSALDPAGYESTEVARLFWVMAAGAIVIWLGMAVLAYAGVRSDPVSQKTTRRLMWLGGIAAPTLILAILLAFGLSLMPKLRAAANGPSISVSGKQFWWRVGYTLPGSGDLVASANELRLPVGQRTQLILDSPDVIHSFWVPALAGKVDMIPGRTTRLVLEPTRSGTFRGQCAELCGDSHANMAIIVEVMEPEAFDMWLSHLATPAQVPENEALRQGRALFFDAGCQACHAIRGTPARGEIGPDLTHVAGRATIGAGMFPANAGTIAGWIADSQHLKPGNPMPSFSDLPGRDLRLIATYLASLE